MSRIGAIVRRLYGEELEPAANNAGGTKAQRPSSRKRRKLTALKNALGKRRTVIWTIRIVVALVALFIAAESVFQFNRLVSWRTVVMARRADVDRELQRRENLIPNMVYAVSKYAAYEQGVFKYVSDAREALKTIRSSGTSETQTSSLLEKTLSRLVALAEEYPDLKATQSIQDLIKEAANTENRIAEVKKEYNKACEIYNQYQSTFPGNVFAFIYRFKPVLYIGLEEDVNVPVIDLKIPEGRTRAEGDSKVAAIIGPEEEVNAPVMDMSISEDRKRAEGDVEIATINWDITELEKYVAKDLEIVAENLKETEGAEE